MVTEFGKCKAVVRDIISSMITDRMDIFTLPQLNFTIEEKASIAVCCEKDVNIYKQQELIAPSNCLLYNAIASDIIGQYFFDLIYLDFCGPICNEVSFCLERLKLNENGTVIITLLKGRESIEYKHLLHYDRLDGYKNILKAYGLYLYEVYEYIDTTPMIVLFASNKKQNGKYQTFLVT